MTTCSSRAASVLIRSIATMGMLAGAGVASAQNVLVNPGFESGVLSPWFQDRDLSPAGVNWHVSAAEAHSGDFSALARGNKSVRQNFPAIPASSVAEVSFWIRHPIAPQPGEGSNVAINYFYDGNQFGPEFLMRVNDSEWTFFNVTGLLDRTRMLTGFAVWGYTSIPEPPTFLDDVVLRVPEPSGAACASMVMCGLLRRRPRRGE